MRRRGKYLRCLALLATGVLAGGHAIADGPPGGEIGYVMTDLFWSVYQTEDAREECPRGFNDGPREQFEQLFPRTDELGVEDTQLRQEMATWHPDTRPDGFEFKAVEGSLSLGMDLDA